MSCPKEARKRSKTITFWLTPGQVAEIDKLVRLSGLTKQDYFTRRALDKQVTIVPSSRVVKSLKCYAERIADKLDALTIPVQLDDDILLDEVRCCQLSWQHSPDTARRTLMPSRGSWTAKESNEP